MTFGVLNFELQLNNWKEANAEL